MPYVPEDVNTARAKVIFAKYTQMSYSPEELGENVQHGKPCLQYLTKSGEGVDRHLQGHFCVRNSPPPTHTHTPFCFYSRFVRTD